MFELKNIRLCEFIHYTSYKFKNVLSFKETIIFGNFIKDSIEHNF